jgi:DNA-binding NtrC family response regulator
MAQVLSVGQCGPDSRALAEVLASVGADVERARSVDDAIAKMNENSYKLVLVNRIFDATGESGVEFIRRVKRDDGVVTAMMLVSNYPEAQAQAVANGARPGFGKSQLGDQAVLELLRDALRGERPEERG